MNIIEAIILGIVQGLTEFLPVSSTAHLTVAGKLLGLVSDSRPEEWTAFIAVIQLGTLAAVLIYFARDIREILLSFFRENLQRIPLARQSHNSRMGWYVIIGTLPIVIAGLGLKKVIEGHLTKDATVIGTSLIVLAVILFVAERSARFARGVNDVTLKDAILIGAAQACALIPGSSRSGTTITAGLFAGLTREAAARFSFLLSIPAVLASGLLELKQVIPYIDSHQAVSMTVAAVTSGLVGYASIAFLLRYLKSHTVLPFVVYRIILGVLLLLFMR
ncbi:undecaprenyl-diphosphate phosphatase [Ignavibacteria bacterium]|nr:undecaprenyl-diphosphatase UppP [Bacteroidota bacterium]MCZ2132163.1 undecaprenyl-diphosphatase UppP [Bacteroidota bacterium]